MPALRSEADGAPKCIAFGGVSVDEEIGRQLVRVVRPAAVEAAVLAHRDERHRRDEVRAALERDLEAARYAAQRAGKQFDAVGPANRLVADELGRRRGAALAQVHDLEKRLASAGDAPDPSAGPTCDEFTDLVRELGEVWRSPESDARLKKRIVRTLIEEVVADVDAAAGEIILQIHWKGGVHTELKLPRRRRGQVNSTSKDVVTAVRSLARTCSADVIAGVLNRNELRTGRGNRWTRERVVSLRAWNEIPCFSRDRCAREGWLKLNEAAAFLGVSPRTLRPAVERGEIAGEHPLSDGPWIINRQALESPAAIQLVERARRSTRAPAKPAAQQETLGFSDI
jgi:hypothetical protein